MKRILRLSPTLNITVSTSGTSPAAAEMPCPFLSRLSSTFVKNYSGKLLKTYGDHCPVMSKQGVTAVAPSTAHHSSLPAVKVMDIKDDIEVWDGPSQSKCISDAEQDNRQISNCFIFSVQRLKHSSTRHSLLEK